MAYKDYSDSERAEALVRLAVNRYDYEKTAEQVGVSVRTLRRWDKDVPKKGVADLLERAIERLLMVIPENLTGTNWAITLGILMDKWLLIQGQPTSRTEGIFRALGELNESERDSIIEEAERILAEATSGGHSEGDSRR